MVTTSHPASTSEQPIRGKIVEAEIKVSVDAARPLPFVCALYGIKSSDGVWLCAYYGANRSNFDYLPQKDAEVDEVKLGIAFHTKKFIAKDQYQPTVWEDFKKAYFIAYGGREE